MHTRNIVCILFLRLFCFVFTGFKEEKEKVAKGHPIRNRNSTMSSVSEMNQFQSKGEAHVSINLGARPTSVSVWGKGPRQYQLEGE